MLYRLVSALLKGEKEFSRELEEVIQEVGIDLREFSRRCGIPYSTLYKIVRGERSPTLSTLRRILSAFRREENFIAVIAARHILEETAPFREKIAVRSYPATNFEEALVMAVRAEKDGAMAIVCAPVLSTTIQKMVDIPVFTMKPKDSILKAVRQAVEKVSLS
ncbi:MAG: helix-turn-helix domain-containing protein [Archaeoglobus sp.]|nr:helix-turn-helix domain-containing protein [Archaeoglobus sp.]